MDQLNLDNVSIQDLRDGYKGVMGLLSGDENPNDTTIPRHMAKSAVKLRAAIGDLHTTMMGDQGFYAHEDGEGPLSKIKKIADPKNKAPKSAGDQLFLKSFMVLLGANDQQQLFNTLNGVENTPSPLAAAPVGEVTRGSLAPAEIQASPQDIIKLQAEALGFEGVYEAGLANHSSLQREFGLGLKDIANLSDLALEQRIMSQLVENVDHTKLFEKAMAGDIEAIKQMQAVVGAEITGQLDSQTSGKFNDFVENHNPGLEGLRGHLEYENGNKMPSTNSLYNAIKNGNVPIIESALPEHLKGLPEGAFAQESNARLLASHLTQETNFVKYDAALKAQDAASDIKLKSSFTTASGSDIAVLSQPAVEARVAHAQETTANATILKTEAISLETAIAPHSQAFDSVYDRLTTNMATDTSLPQDVRELAEMKQNIGVAEQSLDSYLMSPLGLNTNNTFGIKVAGAVGAPYAPITQALENDVTSAQNNMMAKFTGMSDAQRQGVLSHLDGQSQSAPDAVNPDGQKFQAPANESGGFLAGIKSFFATSTANASPVADNQNSTNPARRAAITGADNNNVAASAPALGGGGW